MKIFALKEESSDNSETVVYGWLTYFEEEKEQPKDLKVDSLDDLFNDDDNKQESNEKPKNKTNSIPDAPILPDSDDFSYDIQKELEAKFDELFGTEGSDTSNKNS